MLLFSYCDFPLDSVPARALFEIQSLQEFKIPTIEGGLHNDNAVLFNGAAGGFFHTEKSDNRYKLIFKAEILTNFNVFIAVRVQGYWNLILRLITSWDRVFCLPMKQNERLGRNFSIPGKFTMNTALVLCLQETTFDADIKLLGEQHGNIHWDITSFVVSGLMDMKHSDEYIRIDGNLFQRCPGCLVIARDGRHSEPCPPLHTTSALRKHIYSNETSCLFQLRFENLLSEVEFLVDGSFKKANNEILINSVIEGIFRFNILPPGKQCLSFDAITMNRFCILLAFHYREAWRIRLGLVFSRKNGVLGFRLTKTLLDNNGRFNIPKTWEANTVLLIGIHPNNMDVPMTLRIFANQTGVDIQPYKEQILWNFDDDEIQMSDGLQTKNAKKRSFAKHLYSNARYRNVSQHA